MNYLNIDSKKELLPSEAGNLIGFTLLGQYITKADLILYKGSKYQPQITINIEIPLSQRNKFGISIDRNSGYKVVQITDDGKTRIITNVLLIKTILWDIDAIITNCEALIFQAVHLELLRLLDVQKNKNYILYHL